MLKYPITSNNGIEYAVEIFEGKSIYFAGINIYIYKKREKPSLFKCKYIKLKKYNIMPHHSGYREFEYDYVKAIEYAINRYEKEVFSKISEELSSKNRDVNLLLWDGKLRGYN